MKIAGFAFPPHRFGVAGSAGPIPDDEFHGLPDLILMDEDGHLLVRSGRTGELTHGYASAERLEAHTAFWRCFAWAPPGAGTLEELISRSDLPDLLEATSEQAPRSIAGSIPPSSSPASRRVADWIAGHAAASGRAFTLPEAPGSIDEMHALARRALAAARESSTAELSGAAAQAMQGAGLEPMLRQGEQALSEFMSAHGLPTPRA